jgi:hypothetical protein
MPTNLMPALPGFDGPPVSILNTTSDPTGFGRIFDSKHFMAITEFNILNALIASKD